MKLTLHRNSLFAILLRSRWWVSVLVALATSGAVRLFMTEGFAAFAAPEQMALVNTLCWFVAAATGVRRSV